MAAETAIVSVRHFGGDRFLIDVHQRGRSHQLMVDQPVADGGDDLAPTPTELFVASLTSCIAFYARRYLNRHRLPEAVEVEASFEMGKQPSRVETVRLTVKPPALPVEQIEPFMRVISHCTVHNSLEQPPKVEIDVEARTNARALIV